MHAVLHQWLNLCFPVFIINVKRYIFYSDLASSRTIRVRFQAKTMSFLFSQNVQTASGAYPASFQWVPAIPSYVTVTTHVCRMSRLSMSMPSYRAKGKIYPFSCMCLCVSGIFAYIYHLFLS